MIGQIQFFSDTDTSIQSPISKVEEQQEFSATAHDAETSTDPPDKNSNACSDFIDLITPAKACATEHEDTNFIEPLEKICPGIFFLSSLIFFGYTISNYHFQTFFTFI